MTKLNSIVRFLNKELRTAKISDLSRNGLQVRTSKKTIKKVGFAVDAALSVFKKAKMKKVDLLIVHHGLLWKGKEDKTGITKQRLNFLKRNNINLFASHLPLDLHDKYGNNIQLVKLLDLNKIRKFGAYHKTYIGFQGKLKKSTSANQIKNILDRKLKTKSKIIGCGKKKIQAIGIVSGGGAFALNEACTNKLDCFITGEASHSIFHDTKDLKQNVILAGHYETETVGLKALMKLIKSRFDVQTIFIDYPTDL